MASSPKVLLTGATGFVGRGVAVALAKHFPKANILCLGWIHDDEVNTKNRKMLERKGFKVELVDLVTKKNFNKIPKSPDIIIHMAANVNTADPDHKVNDIGTSNLVRHLKLDKNSHFIHTSTTVHTIGHKNVSAGIDEKTVPVPTNEYGRTKLNAEKVLIAECKKKKFKLTILRLNTVYGPDPRPNSMFLQLPEMIKSGSLFTRLNWPGKTALVHVDDVCFAVVNIARKIKPTPGVPDIFIAFSENTTMAEISRQMYKALKIKYNPINLPKFFWKMATYGRHIIPLFEKITSPKLYGSLWRASLIVDDVVYIKTDKLESKFPKWKKKKLSETIKKVL